MIKEVPESWQQALAWWDDEEPVFTIELGGIGPSFEQAMHIAIFETLRAVGDIDLSLHKDTQLAVIAKASTEADQRHRLKLSAAQAGRVNAFVYNVLNKPWRQVVTEYEQDRRIQVMRWWPRP